MQWTLLWLSTTFVGVLAEQRPNIIFILADDLVSGTEYSLHRVMIR